MPRRNLIPLMFLPGLLCDWRLWRDQAAALADIAAPLNVDTTLDDSIAGIAARALAAAPPRFALAAQSMGGYVALEIMRQAPDRVSRLALIDTSARPDSPKRLAQRRVALSSASVGRFVGVTPRLLPQLIHASRVGGPVGVEVMEMTTRVGRDAFLRQQRAIIDRPDFRPVLPAITVPTLVGVGDSDLTTPPDHSLEMHQAIPGARLHVFKDCGHLPPMELPDETTGVLRRWLLG